MRVNNKVKWEAMDANGNVFQYEMEPSARDAYTGGFWISPYDTYLILVDKVNKDVPNWRETKRYIGDEPTAAEVENLWPCVLAFAQAIQQQLASQKHWRSAPKGAIMAQIAADREDVCYMEPTADWVVDLGVQALQLFDALNREEP